MFRKKHWYTEVSASYINRSNIIYTMKPFILQCFLFTLVDAARWCVVQTDNRFDYQQKASFLSFETYVKHMGLDHKVFSCKGLGWTKPAIVKHSCTTCEYILYADTAVIVKEPLDLKQLEPLFQKNISLIAGIDYLRTLDGVRKGRNVFVHHFNAGLFIVRCTTARLLLEQWQSFTRHVKDDQLALQYIAKQGSILEHHVKYDFRYMGIYSTYFSHFPGALRSKFPKSLPTSPLSPPNNCPLAQ